MIVFVKKDHYLFHCWQLWSSKKLWKVFCVQFNCYCIYLVLLYTRKNAQHGYGPLTCLDNVVLASMSSINSGQHKQCCQQCCSAMITMLLQYCSVVIAACNNLLTSWYRRVNNSEHCCSINTNFLLHHCWTILLKLETMLNIVSTEHSLLTVLIA